MIPDKRAILLASAAALLVAFGSLPAHSFPGEITTAAGTGSGGAGGDGGPATEARLRDPAAVVVDGAGNFYIADRGNHRIRKVIAADGEIATVVGSGARGDAGDGGPATDADLDSPSGVALDAQGNIYVADTFNHRIRRVSAATGIITTIAGDGTEGYGGDGGPATVAQLAEPHGIAIDANGRVFIADTNNHRIRRVDLSGNIQTIAGTGDSGFGGDDGPAVDADLNFPNAIAFDVSGDLYIADTENDRIRKVELPEGTIRTVAGNGTSGFSGDGQGALGAKLKKPIGVALDAARHIYIADTENHRIRRVQHGTGIITTIAGTGVAGYNGDHIAAVTARVRVPSGVAADGAGNVLVADTENHRVRRIESPPFAICGNGQLEPGEQCDNGSATNDCCSATCQLEVLGAICRPVAGACDLAEACSGTDAACPADQVKTAGVSCQAGNCAVAASCDGVAPTCPASTLLPPSTVCRGSAGDCDVAENCTGSSPLCPTDSMVPAGTECRAAQDLCDAAESCTGTTPTCPADLLAGPSTVCRISSGGCDPAELCTGSSIACPADQLSTAGTECRAAAGTCDVAEECAGNSADCPADEIVDAGVECRAENGVCDPAEQCTGTGGVCPADLFLPDGTTCDDGDPETSNEVCFEGGCGCPGGDLDGDQIGDGCDPEEASISVKTLVLRLSQTSRGRASGSGEFPIEELGSADVVDVTDGLGIRVLAADDTPLVAVQFPPGGCTVSAQGLIRCKTSDRSSTARFNRRVLSSGTVMTYRFKLGQLDLPGPVELNVRVVITSAWIDRVGAGSSCFLTTSGLRCAG